MADELDVGKLADLCLLEARKMLLIKPEVLREGSTDELKQMLWHLQTLKGTLEFGKKHYLEPQEKLDEKLRFVNEVIDKINKVLESRA